MAVARRGGTVAPIDPTKDHIIMKINLRSVRPERPTRRRRLLVGLLVTSMLCLAGSSVAVAGGRSFDDVPNSNVFRGDIEWLARHGITRGCNPPANTRFCPKEPVTRQQMATFMRKLAASGAVTASGGGGAGGPAGDPYASQAALEEVAALARQNEVNIGEVDTLAENAWFGLQDALDDMAQLEATTPTVVLSLRPNGTTISSRIRSPYNAPPSTTWDAGQERYVIDFGSVEYASSAFQTTCTPLNISPRTVTTAAVDGDLVVTVFTTGGDKVQSAVTCSVYGYGF